MFEWKNLFKGMLMGASDVVPGVSGGTIALLVGIYERLIEAIDGLVSKDWKKHVIFLLPVGIGMGISIVSLSHLISWLMEKYPKPTFFFFLGLIIAIIPILLREADFKKAFKFQHYVLLLIAAVGVAMTAFISQEQTTIMTLDSWNDYLFLFFAGWLASSAMILPGISGSLVLLLLGAYATVIESIKSFDLMVIFVVGMGIVIGLLLTSKLIRFLFNHYRIATYAVIIGFVLGSVIVIYPGWPGELSLMIMSLVAIICGYIIAYFLGRF